MIQNTTLITNFTTLEALAEDFAAKNALTMDLFYGEQSYLSVVIFSCLASKLICDAILRKMSSLDSTAALRSPQIKLSSKPKFNSQDFVLVAGLASMLYVRSFSSFFYALVICISLFLSVGHRRLHVKLTPMRLLAIPLVLVLLGWVIFSSFDYYVHRITSVNDSLSFEQRFSSLYDFEFKDYIVGIDSAAKIPKFGFQNGMLYIIGISGIGGICLLMFLFYRAYVLAQTIKLSLLAIMCVVGLLFQNGGIFTPNKVVLLALVLMPLSCLNKIGSRKRTMPVRMKLANA